MWFTLVQPSNCLLKLDKEGIKLIGASQMYCPATLRNSTPIITNKMGCNPNWKWTLN